MSNIVKAAAPAASAATVAKKSTREFIGRGWFNTKGGKAAPEATKAILAQFLGLFNSGEIYANLMLDRGIQQVTIVNTRNSRMQIFPNKQREGMPTDAHIRLSLVEDTA